MLGQVAEQRYREYGVEPDLDLADTCEASDGIGNVGAVRY
jgi:hypothetical protein